MPLQHYQAEVLDQTSYRSRWRNVAQLRQWAVGIFLAIVTAQYVVDEANRLFSDDLSLHDCAYSLLLVATILLVCAWYYSTERGIEINCSWFAPRAYHPPDTIVEATLTFCFAGLLVLLMLMARHIHIYATVFAVYSWMDSIALRYLNREYPKAASQSRAVLAKETHEPGTVESGQVGALDEAINAIESHYTDKKNALRVRTVALAATVIAGITWLGQIPDFDWIEIAAYLGLVSVIFVSEAVLNLRRYRLDMRLRELRARLHADEGP